uniref:Uncharacterized protein n=1 Tax=Tanacetum cinerariifolium TaxID=118510 RepID=A0A6L2JEC0_TANCI|nr:hypothetical protein [Tanacetum cinerariifolium]
MQKVANISIEPEQTLILPFKEVNADDTANKSLSRTVVQSVMQPKAPTGRKHKKKKDLSSSEPKTSHYVKRSKTKETFIDTQHAEDSVAIADATMKVDSDLESMPENEIMSISEDNNKEAESDQEISLADEKVADNILDELISEADKEDTNVFATTTNALSFESVPQISSTSS